MSDKFYQGALTRLILGAIYYCETQKTHEHMKHFRNVDCVVTNHNNVQDTQANLKTTN